MYGGILGTVRRSTEYSLECPKLLLQVSPTSSSFSYVDTVVDVDVDVNVNLGSLLRQLGSLLLKKDGWTDFYRRCGNMASILEVSPGGKRFFNVFDAAPENESDGPAQQSQVKVSLVLRAS